MAAAMGRCALAAFEVVLEVVGWGLCLYLSWANAVVIAWTVFGVVAPTWEVHLLVVATYNVVMMLLISSVRLLVGKDDNLRVRKVRWTYVKTRFCIDFPLLIALLPFWFAPF